MLELTDELRERVGFPTPVSVEDYDRLWKLRPLGDEKGVYINLCWTVKNSKMNDGSPVTVDIVIEKYKAYLAECQLKKTKDQFITKLDNFILKGKYRENFMTNRHSERKWL